MPVPAPQQFDIQPMLSGFSQGRAAKVALEDRQRALEQQATDAIIRAADLADTPEKWDRFITTIGAQFPDADLSEFADFSSREAAIAQSMDPYQRAQLDLARRDQAMQERAFAAQQAAANRPAATFRPLVTPEDRAAYGIAPTDQGIYQIGPDNRLYQEGGGGQTITINNTDANGIDYGDPPDDFAWSRNPDGTVRLDDRGIPIALPLGPALADANAATTAAANAAAGQARTNDVVANKIGEALGQVNNWTAGVGQQVFGGVGGTGQFDLRATLDTIGANIAFEGLQAMREASPTGGALGNVTVRELELLQATAGNIDPRQSPTQLRQNLRELQTLYLNTIHGEGKWSLDAQGNVVVTEGGAVNLRTGGGGTGAAPAASPAAPAATAPSRADLTAENIRATIQARTQQGMTIMDVLQALANAYGVTVDEVRAIYGRQ